METRDRTVSVRRMQPEDAGAVADLTSQLGYPSGESDIRRRYDHIRNREDATLFVALDTSLAIIGWIHVQGTYLLEADPRAEIWGLVVAESARRSGVGRVLVKAAEEWAAAKGFGVIAVRSNLLRVEAHAFYERLGFEAVKNQRAYRKKLDHSMHSARGPDAHQWDR